ncbi:GntR family transcriptional regulator [Salinisphaera sp. T5B8]|uniref:MocR-like pyridoxine biosynthesis transcription factor PdxR n=1 Tax=Salinisphaera sp. T5B8 TaxID=1304154 RepID=UPI003341F00F
MHPSLQTDRALATPLHRQLYHRFRDAIAAGRFRPGDRVPSIRSLASALNLSRGTVELAYQTLISEGYLLTRGAAGTVVSPALIAARIAPAHWDESTPAGQASTVAERSPSPFQLGLPALDAVPTRLWQRLMTRQLKASTPATLAYPDPQGHYALRHALAAYLGVSRGIDCSPDQIIITGGYCEALRIICCTVLRSGDHGWFEEPGYFKARNALRAAGVIPVPVAVDEDGLDVTAGRRQAPQARFAVVTPSHQSPTGVSLALARRLALLAWANDNDAWIIEDDYDSEYRYQGRPLPALKSLDRDGRVLYAGTFSKVLFPGLRLAYLVVPPSQVARFRRTLDDAGHGCPQLPQAALADFMAEGHFARHLKRMRSLYAQRRGYLIQALATRLSDRLHVEPQAGGMHLLARPKGHRSDIDMADRARRHGLALQALSAWFDGPSCACGLLLGFTNIASQAEADCWVDELKTALDG